MKTLVCFVLLIQVFNNCGFHIVSSSTSNRRTFLIKNKINEIFLRRSKRYLTFEKGATLTIQGNIAKSVIPPAPRGLNFITEYTLSYELPTDLHAFEKKHPKTTKRPLPSTTATTSQPPYQHHMIVPYSHDYFFHMHPQYLSENVGKRRYFHSKKKMLRRKCLNKEFYNYKGTNVKTCLSRAKRSDEWSLSKLTVSQRMFFDLIEKWSLIHGFLPHYCFMRTLCESSEVLLPYGHSLLHDIIHIFLEYTKPWAFHHQIFGRSLRQRYSVHECAKLYGLYCRVSWLDFITNAVHGSRAADFMR